MKRPFLGGGNSHKYVSCFFNFHPGTLGVHDLI